MPFGGTEETRPADTVSRRRFLVSSAGAAGGLCIGFALPGALRNAVAAPSETEINAYITIGTDNSVTILFGGCEFGQGSRTGLAQIVAEELKVRWKSIEIRQADNSAISYLTAGSSAIRRQFDTMRLAGATAREMLIAAAAQRMGVDPSVCRARNGKVKNTATGQKLTYGRLANLAAKQPVPANPPLTGTADYRLIGKSLRRGDVPSKTNGSAVYGIDVRLPGMVYAAVRHCPSLGGTLGKVPRRPRGTIAVVPLTVMEDRGVNLAGNVNAVAVVADNTWAAMRGARSLKLDWQIPPESKALDSAAIETEAQSLMETGSPLVAESDGDVAAGLGSAVSEIDATYSLPYVPHVCMEVLNCTVDYRGSSCEIWAPTQGATWTANAAAAVTGLPTSAITVHTTFLGGGLGRKIEQDFVSQAVQVAMTLDRPVKLTWPREEDFANDQYRPMGLVRVQAGLDANGDVTAWSCRHVSPSILGQRGWLPPNVPDSQATEGATDLRYAFGSRLMEYIPHPAEIPVGFWRSVGHSINAFAVESAVDELAEAAGSDPLSFRRQLLASDARALAVVDAAAAHSPWRNKLWSGHAWGMAFAESFGSLVCQIVEISEGRGGLRVHRVACAVDCGMAINPASVEMQMQGGIVHGLNAALWGQARFTNGQIDTHNFDTYRMLRLNEMPRVKVTIVDSGEALGGIGEPGVPPIAPAIANAYYQLTGTRLRSLPLFPNAGGGGDD